MKKLFTIFVAFFIATSAQAAENMVWKIVPEQSKIEFKVTQDSSVISGSFKKFDGKILFDKNQLAKSKVVIDIDTSSILVSLNEAAGTVQSPEWLSTKAFPKATFSAEKFSAVGKGFRAEGNLTIKGKTAPAVLEFSFNEYTTTKAHAIGKTIIKRSAFGIGNADVKKANGVKDDIEISFVVNAKK
ncbi:MAG: YceI family protein [Proteobacteria bacterium]|nr:YceI family protein [Pseudomonadota bacterium]